VTGPAPPRLHFFAGKGGVGKTTCAAAVALTAAEAGRRVGVISTDPAHSLGDAMGQSLAATPRRVPTRAGTLEAVELDADRALARRRPTLRTIAERGTYLDDEDLERLLRLSFPGVDELMALVEVVRLVDRRRWELTVVDTAPTGHTLRMLDMPATLRRVAAVLDGLHAKHRFLAGSLGRGYRDGAADRLIAELDADGHRLATLLRDAGRCRFTWLLLPEPLSLEETRDGVGALTAAGIAVGELVVNRLTPAPATPCRLCAGRHGEDRRALWALRRAFPSLPLRGLPALDGEPRGPGALRALGRRLGSRAVMRDGAGARSLPRRGVAVAPRRRGGWPTEGPGAERREGPAARSVEAWLERIVAPGTRLVVFAGKGGVGKTTCAAAAALTLARRRAPTRVLLLSADPAHSLGDALAVALGDDERAVPGAPAGLRARELDADAAFARTRERYRRAVEDTFDALLRGARFDVAYDREALHGLIDLAPPGLDELFAVLSIVDALFERRPPPDVVVLDTAPTGHALRLLEMPATALAWVHALLAILLKYREVVGLGGVAAELVATARRLRELRALLEDPTRAGVVVVTRAAELPQRETRRLLARLGRLRLAVPAVVVNARTTATCGRCRRAARAEHGAQRALGPVGARRRRPWSMIVTPAVAPPPRGGRALEWWARTWDVDG
jgi:arsenite-transporting ATPase